MTIEYQIIYWRDIPAQIKARGEDGRTGRELSKRFNVAIDEAAMRAGLTESGAYLAEWRKSDWVAREGELAVVADDVTAELEANYPAERLRQLVAQFGLERAEL